MTTPALPSKGSNNWYPFMQWLYDTVRNSGGGSTGGTVADATTTSKGVVQLAGDLGGTASAPTVPAVQSATSSGTANALFRRDASGGGAVGYLSISSTPANPDNATRKDYVDNGLAAKVTAVNHGSNASTARPTGAISVTWIGSVQPTNMTDADLWIAPA